MSGYIVYISPKFLLLVASDRYVGQISQWHDIAMRLAIFCWLIVDKVIFSWYFGLCVDKPTPHNPFWFLNFFLKFFLRPSCEPMLHTPRPQPSTLDVLESSWLLLGLNTHFGCCFLLMWDCFWSFKKPNFKYLWKQGFEPKMSHFKGDPTNLWINN